MNDTEINIDITDTVHGILEDLSDDLPDCEAVLAVLSLIVAVAVDAFDADLDEVMRIIRESSQSLATKH